MPMAVKTVTHVCQFLRHIDKVSKIFSVYILVIYEISVLFMILK